jgi:UDP-N-acetylmuramate: L-alanyl-gamma-D-glutamyl-meso-diaminopimelate ligase
VAREGLAPIVEVGFSENCAERIRNVSYPSAGSHFTLGETTFDSPLIGEFNVRNAAMAAVAARFYGVAPEVIQTALTSFEGIARRQEVRGRERGVTVIDDFGHHPTAIRETLRALRRRYPGQRLWAIFEPRSNTTRRAVFQQQLPEALQLADGIFISQVAALEQIPAADRLHPEAVVAALAAAGRIAFYEPNAAAIVERIVPLLEPDDVVTVFSNGGFDGIHAKLLERLRD